jgi:hypothetical protein
VYLPGTTTRAVNAVGTSDDFVVLKTIPVKLFPVPGFRRNDIFNPAHAIYPF